MKRVRYAPEHGTGPKDNDIVHSSSSERDQKRNVQDYSSRPKELKPSAEVLYIANLLNQLFTLDNLVIYGTCMANQTQVGGVLGASEQQEIRDACSDGTAQHPVDMTTKYSATKGIAFALGTALSMVRCAAGLAENELFNLMKGAALVAGNPLLAGSIQTVLGKDAAKKLWTTGSPKKDAIETPLSKKWRTQFGNTWAGATDAAEDIATHELANQYRSLHNAWEKSSSFASFF